MKNRIYFAALISVVLLSLPIDAHPQRAGRGTYEPYVLKLDGTTTDNTPVVAGVHYLRIEVPTWFVNNESDFLKKKMVSGTVEIKIGDENYNAILGSFPLTGDNKLAPVFNRTLLDNRAYNGGDLTIKVFLKGIKKDTAMGSLLKSLEETALNVAVGQIGTMTGLGAVPALSDASQKLTDGVKASLNSGDDQYGIFEINGGLETTFRKTTIATLGQETFWLAYRGDSLRDKRITIVANGRGGYDVQAASLPLRQGAWVLFRISRESTYGNYRPWAARAQQIQNDLNRLMQDWQVDAKNLVEVKTALTATLQGDQISDRILALRSIIESDSALSFTEQGLEKARLITLYEIAMAATNKVNGHTDYFPNVREFQESLRNGSVPTSEVTKAVFKQEFKSVATQAADQSSEDLVKILTSGTDKTVNYAYSDVQSTRDTSLLIAELESRLKNKVDTVNEVVSLTESDLWKRLGELERARTSKQRN